MNGATTTDRHTVGPDRGRPNHVGVAAWQRPLRLLGSGVPHTTETTSAATLTDVGDRCFVRWPMSTATALGSAAASVPVIAGRGEPS